MSRYWRKMMAGFNPNTVPFPRGTHVLFRYDHKPQWWARTPATVGFLSVITLATFNTLELTRDYWTRPVQPPSDAQAQVQVTKSDGTLEAPNQAPPVTYELRPLWQRVIAGGLCLAAGTVPFVVIFAYRMRLIRSMRILAPSANKGTGTQDRAHRVFVECVHHRPNRGYLIPFTNTYVIKGISETDTLLHFKDIRGGHIVDFDNVRLNGQEVPKEVARDTLYEVWGSSLPKPLDAPQIPTFTI